MAVDSGGLNSDVCARHGDWVMRMRFWREITRDLAEKYAAFFLRAPFAPKPGHMPQSPCLEVVRLVILNYPKAPGLHDAPLGYRLRTCAHDVLRSSTRRWMPCAPPPSVCACAGWVLRDQEARLSERSEFERLPRKTRPAQVARSVAEGRRQRGRLSFAYFSLAKQRKVSRPPGRDPAPELKIAGNACKTPALTRPLSQRERKESGQYR